MTQSNPDLEVAGESILQTPAMMELFERGKTWITKHWEKVGRPSTKIQVEEKKIGRNAGFIMEVSISNPVATVRYFAKVQRAHMDTIMTHYLLKYTNSGPDVFLIVPLKNHVRDGRNGEGVITMEVPNFKMATVLTASDRKLLQRKPALARSQFFLLTLLVEFGHFANIPGNTENWGYASNALQEDSTDKLERLVLVDFSSSRENYLLDNKHRFYARWHCNYYRYGERSLEWQDFDMKEQTRLFPWLQSAQAFTALLQRVMRSTEEWLLHAESISMSDAGDIPDAMEATHLTVVREILNPFKGVVSASINGSANRTGTSTTKATSETSGVLDISPLIETLYTTAQPHIEELIREYVEWVGRWNRQCEKMFKWMPFPKRAKVKCTVQVGAVKLKSHLRRRQVTYQYRM